VDANDEGRAYHPCFETNNINLPAGYYFGVSVRHSKYFKNMIK
jgi:hypothetical protein